MKRQKENSHENITWYEMGKQKAQAKEVRRSYRSQGPVGMEIWKSLRITHVLRTRPELLEAWLGLASVSYHRNVSVSILLNLWLALTKLRAIGLRLEVIFSGTMLSVDCRNILSSKLTRKLKRDVIGCVC